MNNINKITISFNAHLHWQNATGENGGDSCTYLGSLATTTTSRLASIFCGITIYPKVTKASVAVACAFAMTLMQPLKNE
jgi:hypothetical protein